MKAHQRRLLHDPGIDGHYLTEREYGFLFQLVDIRAAFEGDDVVFVDVRKELKRKIDAEKKALQTP
jgi:hypothetical protein